MKNGGCLTYWKQNLTPESEINMPHKMLTLAFFHVFTSFQRNGSIFATDANFLIRPKAFETISKMAYHNVFTCNFSCEESKVTRLMRLTPSFY